MELEISTFGDSLMEVVRVLGLVLMALLGISGSAEKPAPGMVRDLPVEMRAVQDQVVFGDPVSMVQIVDFAGNPAMELTLSAADARVLSEFTGRHVKEQIEVVVCGVVQLRPVVMEPISGGKLWLTGPDSVSNLETYLANGCP